MISFTEAKGFQWRAPTGQFLTVKVENNPLAAVLDHFITATRSADEAKLNELASEWNSIVVFVRRYNPAAYSSKQDQRVKDAIAAQRTNLTAIMEKAEEEVGTIEHVEPRDYVSPTLITNETPIAPAVASGMSTTTMVLAAAGVLGAILLIRKLKKGRK
jgi:hypothetical protein